jgi:NADP-dependent aldehyde dehydrogenase
MEQPILNKAGQNRVFQATNPATGEMLAPVFTEFSADQVNQAVTIAEQAFQSYRSQSGPEKALFLETAGEELRSIQNDLIAYCQLETGLPEGRLLSELTRTINQLKLFSGLLREGSWRNARIDRAQPDRLPLPGPDLRQIQVPLGPVGIFGASNFPFAFSVAGGDTVSALAAGCTVVVKAHPAHPGTSEMVSEAIRSAARKTGLPEGVLTLVHGQSATAGMAIVSHPGIQAIGFTGSTKGGMAIAAAAAARNQPIPVFAEMGSTNPVFILPGALRDRSTVLANALVSSATLGVGQFCTNPGLVIVPEGPDAENFIANIVTLFTNAPAGIMLTQGISQAYRNGIDRLINENGAVLIASGKPSDYAACGIPYLLRTSAATALAHPAITGEVFGPSTLVITTRNKTELLQFAEYLTGHLTATIHAHASDLNEFHELPGILERKAGRIILNGFPTGVEVAHSMVHGGPFPATTDSRTTSVGTAAIYRFTRPVCYQDYTPDLLPAELLDENPLRIWRLVDGELKKDALSIDPIK